MKIKGIVLLFILFLNSQICIQKNSDLAVYESNQIIRQRLGETNFFDLHTIIREENIQGEIFEFHFIDGENKKTIENEQFILDLEIISEFQDVDNYQFQEKVVQQKNIEGTGYYVYLLENMQIQFLKIDLFGRIQYDGEGINTQNFDIKDKFSDIDKCFSVGNYGNLVIIDCNFSENSQMGFITFEMNIQNGVLLNKIGENDIKMYQFQETNQFNLNQCETRQMAIFNHNYNRRTVLAQYCSFNLDEKNMEIQTGISQYTLNYEIKKDLEIVILNDFQEVNMDRVDENYFCREKLIEQYGDIDQDGEDISYLEQMNILAVDYYYNQMVVFDYRSLIIYISINENFDFKCTQIVPTREFKGVDGTKIGSVDIQNARFQHRSNLKYSQNSLFLYTAERNQVYQLNVSDQSQLKYVDHITIELEDGENQKILNMIFTRNYIIVLLKEKLLLYHKNGKGRIFREINFSQTDEFRDNPIVQIRNFDRRALVDIFLVALDDNVNQIWHIQDTFMKIVLKQNDEIQTEEKNMVLNTAIQILVHREFQTQGNSLNTFILEFLHQSIQSETQILYCNQEFELNLKQNKQKMKFNLEDLFFGQDIQYQVLGNSTWLVQDQIEQLNQATILNDVEQVLFQSEDYELFEGIYHSSEQYIEILTANQEQIQISQFNPTAAENTLSQSYLDLNVENLDGIDDGEVEKILVESIKKYSKFQFVTLEKYNNNQFNYIFHYDKRNIPFHKQLLKIIDIQAYKVYENQGNLDEIKDQIGAIIYLSSNLYVTTGTQNSLNPLFALISQDMKSIYFCQLKIFQDTKKHFLQLTGKFQLINKLNEIQKISLVDFYYDGTYLSLYVQGMTENKLYKYSAFYSKQNWILFEFYFEFQLLEGCSFDVIDEKTFTQICPFKNEISIYYETLNKNISFLKSLILDPFIITNILQEEIQIFQENKFLFIQAQKYLPSKQKLQNYLLIYDYDTFTNDQLRISIELDDKYQDDRQLMALFLRGNYENGIYVTIQNGYFMLHTLYDETMIQVVQEDQQRAYKRDIELYSIQKQKGDSYITKINVDVDLNTDLESSFLTYGKKINQWENQGVQQILDEIIDTRGMEGPLEQLTVLNSFSQEISNFEYYITKIVQNEEFNYLEDFFNVRIFGELQDFLVLRDFYYEFYGYDQQEQQGNQYDMSCIEGKDLIVVLTKKKLIFMDSDNQILLVTKNKLQYLQLEESEDEQEDGKDTQYQSDTFCFLLPYNSRRSVFQYCPIYSTLEKNIVRYDFHDICSYYKEYQQNRVRYPLENKFISYLYGDISIGDILKIQAIQFDFQKDENLKLRQDYQNDIFSDYLVLFKLEEDSAQSFVTISRYIENKRSFTYTQINLDKQFFFVDLDSKAIFTYDKDNQLVVYYLLLLMEENTIYFLIVDPLQISYGNEKKFIIQIDSYPINDMNYIKLLIVNYESLKILNVEQNQEDSNLIDMYVLTQSKNKFKEMFFQMQIKQDKEWWQERYYIIDQTLHHYEQITQYENYNKCDKYIQQIEQIYLKDGEEEMVFRICYQQQNEQDDNYVYYMNIYKKFSNSQTQLVAVMEAPLSEIYQMLIYYDKKNLDNLEGFESQIRLFLPSYQNVLRSFSVQTDYSLSITQNQYVNYQGKDSVLLDFVVEGYNNQQSANININVQLVNMNPATHLIDDRFYYKLGLFLAFFCLMILILLKFLLLKRKMYRKEKQSLQKKIEKQSVFTEKDKGKKKGSGKNSKKRNRRDRARDQKMISMQMINIKKSMGDQSFQENNSQLMQNSSQLPADFDVKRLNQIQFEESSHSQSYSNFQSSLMIEQSNEFNNQYSDSNKSQEQSQQQKHSYQNNDDNSDSQQSDISYNQESDLDSDSESDDGMYYGQEFEEEEAKRQREKNKKRNKNQINPSSKNSDQYYQENNESQIQTNKKKNKKKKEVKNKGSIFDQSKSSFMDSEYDQYNYNLEDYLEDYHQEYYDEEKEWQKYDQQLQFEQSLYGKNKNKNKNLSKIKNQKKNKSKWSSFLGFIKPRENSSKVNISNLRTNQQQKQQKYRNQSQQRFFYNNEYYIENNQYENDQQKQNLDQNIVNRKKAVTFSGNEFQHKDCDSQYQLQQLQQQQQQYQQKSQLQQIDEQDQYQEQFNEQKRYNDDEDLDQFNKLYVENDDSEKESEFSY